MNGNWLAGCVFSWAPGEGAIVALLSNSAVNWLLYPETGADVVIFPRFAGERMAAPVIGAGLARQTGFQEYLRKGRSSALSHAWFLYIFGVGGAIVSEPAGNTFVSCVA